MDAPRSFGKEAADDPMWFRIYSLLYGWNVTIERVTDRAAQRRGIDRIVVLPSGRRLSSQEKHRPTRSLLDVAIEVKHVHSDGYERPGWIVQPSDADLFIYACSQDWRAFACRASRLKAAWAGHAEKWQRIYPVVWSAIENGDYRTGCCCVPLTVLLKHAGGKVVCYERHYQEVK